jgi:hypothetical protein
MFKITGEAKTIKSVSYWFNPLDRLRLIWNWRHVIKHPSKQNAKLLEGNQSKKLSLISKNAPTPSLIVQQHWQLYED